MISWPGSRAEEEELPFLIWFSGLVAGRDRNAFEGVSLVPLTGFEPLSSDNPLQTASCFNFEYKPDRKRSGHAFRSPVSSPEIYLYCFDFRKFYGFVSPEYTHDLHFIDRSVE